MCIRDRDNSQLKDRNYETEGCVIILVVFTILAGFSTVNQSTPQFFALAMALGLSAIAAAILHLAKVLQDSKT